MSASAMLETIRAAGLSVRLGDSNTLKVTPAAPLARELRALIQGHKHDLVLALATLANDHETRVTCTTCRHLRPGNRCNNHRRAALTTRELAAEFIRLRQHSPAMLGPSKAIWSVRPMPLTLSQCALARVLKPKRLRDNND